MVLVECSTMGMDEIYLETMKKRGKQNMYELERNTSSNIFLESGPLISVVIPIYNMENYLSKCVDSILNQTYRNLEIILVDDCSTDKSEEIIKQYVDQDDRIKAVAHQKNMGLFQARISGCDIATGKYIAFVDSDDYVSCDWFRMLLKKAEEEQADITVGEWCYDYGEEKRYCNMDHFRIKNYCLVGEDALREFMRQEGRNFSWSVVWNKLYTKTLWDKCVLELKKFSEEHGHMLMWEDIAFSAAFWIHAAKMVNVHGINYFYVQHKGASTSPNKNKTRNLKYISDASAALLFVKEQLIAAKKFDKFEKNYLGWYSRYSSIVYHDIVIDQGQWHFEKVIRESFNFYEKFSERENFFYSLQTCLGDSFWWLEDIKKKILQPNVLYVSFDVFDTLIQRPFWEPADLFQLLSERVNQTCSAYVNFATIRREAEANCRKINGLERPSREEVELDEIYDFIARQYAFDRTMLNEIEKYEMELEFKFAKERKIGKLLYELAIDAGKEVVLCSDMYLPQVCVEEILAKNNYKNYKKLYLSSTLQKTKHSKSLFQHVKKELGCTSAGEIIHIGDNWNSDVENAKACGFEAGHLSRTVDVLCNYNPGIYSGQSFYKIFQNNNLKDDYRQEFWSYTGVRCAMALVSNKIFDNPYVSFQSNSDFNGDPNYIGYYAFGMHMLAVAHWVTEVAKEKKIPTIHFVARDGYMVKKAFDVVNQTNTKSGYIRISRRALLLADVNRKEDLYFLYNKINVFNCSPKKLTNYLEPLIPSGKEGSVADIVTANGFCYDKKFQTLLEYERCLKLLIDEVLDFSQLAAYKEQLRAYFASAIKPGDYIFDIGYSGRPETALSNLLGFPVGSLYIHTNSEIANIRQAKYNCDCKCFYNVKPCITGVMREHVMMELGPSTIGYEIKDGKLMPKMENYEPSYEGDLITTIVQSAALEFVKDYHENFGDKLVLPLDTLSAPFEYYIHYSRQFDRQIFSTLKFEDKLGDGKVLKALDFWNNETVVHGLTQELCAGEQMRNLPQEFEDIYMDGLFVKFYKKINKWFPKGGKKRDVVKKIVSAFVR